MATYAQYRFFSTLAEVALDAAMEVDCMRRGKEIDQTAPGEFLNVLKEHLGAARQGDVMSVTCVHQLYAVAVEETEGRIRTVSELLEAFERWIKRCEDAIESREPDGLKRLMEEMLAAHSFAISRLHEAVRERRGRAA
ncbi:hypothetical protein [Rhizobium leguminosarum]|uniref:hypothetical protein n=1 Tax=Rhizobium leguminosarum TaxID=384 RepID=UPI002E14FBAD|nr:hypothetical protein U8Q02_36685 [Rhizobium leguminosarum]